jgi:hypothetical protein
VALVAVLLVAGGPLVSMLGILIGEGVYAVWIHAQLRVWRRSLSLGPQVRAVVPVLASQK